MRRSSSGIHYKYAEKDEEFSLKRRLSRTLNTAEQRLRTDFPDIRHFCLLCAVATVSGLRPHGGAVRARTWSQHSIGYLNDVWRKKKKQEVLWKRKARVVFKSKVGVMYGYFLIIVATLVLLLLTKTCVFCPSFGQYLFLIAFVHRQSGSCSSASRVIVWSIKRQHCQHNLTCYVQGFNYRVFAKK